MMKTIYIVILLLSFYKVDYAQKIVSGALWPDNNGKHINAHGGGILYDKGTYYWFGEHRGDIKESRGSLRVGVTCYSSKDLVNWKNEGVALEMLPDRSFSDIEKGCIIERPKVVFNKKTGKYVMWFHLELKYLADIGERFSAARAGVAISDNITGPYHYLRSSRVNAGFWPENMPEEQRKLSITLDDVKNGTPEWWQAVREGVYVRRDLTGGQMARDMNLFIDDNGKAYHVFSSEDNTTLQIAELTDDFLNHTGRYIRVAPASYNEAPAIFKKDGTYFMITSGTSGLDPNDARLFSAASIWGPWEKRPNPCIGNDSALTFHSQANYVLAVPGKKNAFIFMADRWKPTPESLRSDGRYVWLPIQFEKGLPVLKWIDSWSLDYFDK